MATVEIDLSKLNLNSTLDEVEFAELKDESNRAYLSTIKVNKVNKRKEPYGYQLLYAFGVMLTVLEHKGKSVIYFIHPRRQILFYSPL